MVAFNRGLASNPTALFGGSKASGLARDSLETKYIAVSLHRADELHTEKTQWRSSPREMNNGRVGGNMGAVKNVIVLGGGIGGLTAAHALRRIGVSVRVIEMGDRSDRIGTGITLLGNALRALAELELVEACLQGGHGWDVVSIRDAAGNPLLQQFSPRIWDPDRPAALGIMRPRLGQILEEAARTSGAEIAFNTTVTRIDQDAEGVTVQLSHGETDRADLLIAADGVYSKTRQQIFGEKFKPHYAGQGVWRYTVSRTEAIDGFILYRHPTGRVVGALPLSKELCYLFFLETTDEKLRVAQDQVCHYVRNLLAPFTAPELIQAADLVGEGNHISYRPFDVLMMPAPWHRGRVVLLGDSAHSLTPQMTSGGGMAIEDALVLAQELRRSRDLETALAGYCVRREERVKRIYDIGYAICNEERNPMHSREYQIGLLREGYAFLSAPV
ncbi:2-polyprenyl-6-methoxyphenol hydroxylase-like FAD-dependent oxidoreductase [Bradyrhizobium elkanii]|uniref:FAD-dependent oxidoreductase n=1 Tax=Bradyrhizobium elkanii TaxID=29448 RepID=UPI002167B67E|nr:FAD-dependent monooxygenase [Bradyrhizobium elkanii]MCS3695166.1 2-polyprenyl-6-methoxyphenol hydroxylase-like FAD-dependent oxidoreductase [Bradyrhizobium elkanii]